eukprot:Nk52_evm102s226 gene=Nk52_evmTU102s226
MDTNNAIQVSLALVAGAVASYAVTYFSSQSNSQNNPGSGSKPASIPEASTHKRSTQRSESVKPTVHPTKAASEDKTPERPSLSRKSGTSTNLLAKEKGLSDSFENLLVKEGQHRGGKPNLVAKEEEKKPRMYRVVLTGGPCAGKSSALAAIQERMSSLGFDMYMVPEMATILIRGGTRISPENVYNFQVNLLKAQMALENAFFNIAKFSQRDSIVVCDRGTMDTAAFLDDDTWANMMEENDWNVTSLRDKRYDAVIHLVTAAIGAESFYTTANNNARTESEKEAIEQDYNLRDAWLGHNHFRVIDNSSDFNGKIKRTLECMSHIVGVPMPVSGRRLFLVNHAPDESEINVKFQKFKIETVYLNSGKDSGVDHHTRLSKKGQNGSYTYTVSTQKKLDTGERVLIERQISGREFNEMQKNADHSRRHLVKKRKAFLYDCHYFNLDTYTDPTFITPIITLLEIEVDSHGKIELPSFLEVDKEVTQDSTYDPFFMSVTGSSILDSKSPKGALDKALPKQHSKDKPLSAMTRLKRNSIIGLMKK